jgi:phage terminase small subunit
MTKLTAKQQRFVEAYLANPNGARAAIAAGYSRNTARVIASENLRKPAIVAALAKARKRRQAREEYSIKQVRKELADIGFCALTDIFGEGKQVLDPSEWPGRLKGVVHYEKRERIKHTRDGQTERIVTLIKVQMPKKLEALEMLGESLGMFPPRRRQGRG